MDSLLAFFDGCYGFLEVATILLDVAAVYLGIQTYKRLAAHSRKKPSWTAIIVLLVVAVFFTVLVVYKYTRH